VFANFIGGKRHRPEGCPTIPVYNPASGEVMIGQTPPCTAAEGALAVAAAARMARQHHQPQNPGAIKST